MVQFYQGSRGKNSRDWFPYKLFKGTKGAMNVLSEPAHRAEIAVIMKQTDILSDKEILLLIEGCSFISRWWSKLFVALGHRYFYT